MATKPNFMRLFSNAYDGVRTSGDIKLLPLYSSIEETLLAAEYTSTSADVVKFFYENTDLTDKEVAAIYYDHFPKPANARGTGNTMQTQSVRNKRKVLSDQMYFVFGDDFFKMLVTESNYLEVNWRKNVINHKFYDFSRLISSDASRVLRGIVDTFKPTTNTVSGDKSSLQSSGSSAGDLVNFEKATTGVYNLDDCKQEIDFIYRYLDPALVLASYNLDPEKVSYLLSVMEGGLEKSMPGTRFQALGQILSRSAFSRPAREGS